MPVQLSRKMIFFVLAIIMLGVLVIGSILGLMFYSGYVGRGYYLGGASEGKSAASPASTATESTSLAGFVQTYEVDTGLPIYSKLDTIGRMMVYTASLGLEVRDVNSAIDSICATVQGLEGNLTGISTSNEGGTKTAMVTIRVPQEDFYAAIQAIEALGEVKSKEVKGEDVTEQYIDLSARLSNLQKEEQRLTDIMGMCTTVEDVLKVESELSRVRGQIEQLIGQIRYLESRVDFATIVVSLSEAERWITTPEMDWGKPIEAGLWGVFIVTQGLIALGIGAAPFIAIGTPLYYVYRRIKARKESPPEAQR